MSTVNPTASAAAAAPSPTAASQYAYSAPSNCPSPLHLQQQQLAQPYIGSAPPPIPPVQLPVRAPVVASVSPVATTLPSVPQYQQAEQLFQRNAQTVTPEGLESVKSVVASCEIENEAETKKKATPRKAAGQTWEDHSLSQPPETLTGTELVRRPVKEENVEFPSIPPGFESVAPFTLKRVEGDEIRTNTSASGSAFERCVAPMKTELECGEDLKSTKALKRNKPWIGYGRYDNSLKDESESEQNFPFRPQLPKGVIRGCEQCSSCQKVTAKWRPDEACKLDLQEAPVFYPSEEEFEDTLKYIASIRGKAETYGICRIVPPPSWRPPCPLKEKNIWEDLKFSTRIQRIDKLQNRDSKTKISRNSHQMKRKRRRCMKAGSDNGNTNALSCEAVAEPDNFGFEPGPRFTLDTFQKYADDFKAQYFRKADNISLEPSIENIEGEYWRMVEKPTEEIEVLYGADLETGVFCSGFPKDLNQVSDSSDMKYVNSGWNLNNFPRLPGSVLSYESNDISGVLVPWLYIGMCFSSFCWHVEDHHLYSLNYMHWGAPKMWYGVPGTDALKLEAAMRKHLPDLFEEQPDLLHKLVTQLSPSILKSEGVPVYRCTQNAGEFVLTFPRAYHAGFNCGFNCAEAVNVAPVDWLPHGQRAIELYREQNRKTSISHDKLLLGAAREAVKAHWELNLLRKNTSNNLRWKDLCGRDGVLSKALRERIEMERVRRQFLCSSSQALKMESTFDSTSERECSVCNFDLHLSAAGCHNCSPDKYACLNHAKQLCSCSWGSKFFLFRYDTNELNILVEAVEGKLSSVYRWARLDLGLALSAYISKENSQGPKVIGKLSHTLGGSAPKEASLLAAQTSLREQQEREDIHNFTSTKATSRTCSHQKDLASREISTVEKMKTSSTSDNPCGGVDPRAYIQCKREVSIEQTPDIKASVSASAEIKNALSCSLASDKPTDMMKPSSLANSDVIFLSDDEGDESKLPPPGKLQDVKKEPGVEEGCTNDPTSTPHLNKATIVGGTSNFSSSSESTKVQDHEKGRSKSDPNSSVDAVSHSKADFDQNGKGFSNSEITANCAAKADNCLENMQTSDNGNPNNKDNLGRLESDANLRSMENMQAASGDQSASQNNLDRYYRQKGPRIAKVVRRINCNVEPLEFGTVQCGKLWCDNRAIYPKGFKSRVRYINALDPANMCYYLSEILDAGRDGPLFMVSLEHSPSEIFVHTSAMRCWEMVRERVNQEITKQHKLGRTNLPPLQPPGSLDGLEMFGFSSPAIIQVVQAMDKNRVCTEYWKTRPLMQIPQHPQTGERCHNSVKSETSDDYSDCIKSLPAEVGTVLSGLFKKATSDELAALCSSLSVSNSNSNEGLVVHILKEEIEKRQR